MQCLYRFGVSVAFVRLARRLLFGSLDCMWLTTYFAILILKTSYFISRIFPGILEKKGNHTGVSLGRSGV
jgi:hypothetical protein